jgi:hypothetical protein
MPVRDLYKIAMNYIKGRLLYDVVTIIPFSKLFTGLKRNNLFYCVKVSRLSKGYYLLDTKKFKQSIKASYK